MFKQVHYFGTVLFMCSLVYLINVVLTEIFEDESAQVDDWLEQNELGEYKKLFKEYGEFIFNNGKNVMIHIIFVFKL